MTAKTTTGIVLTRHSGQYACQGQTWPDDTHLDDVAASLGLSRGYWLRKDQTGRATTYTWMQL